VSCGGQGTFAVPMRSDASYNQATADANGSQCAADTTSAEIDASNGHPWAATPEYHPNAGVCFVGTH